VPDLIRYYLHAEPILPNVDTWRLEEDAAREEVLDRLEELVVKPVDGSGGKGIVIGPRASKEELDALRRRVTTDPRGWIAQPVVQLSTVPTLIDDRLAPRHVDLRPFAVNSGDDVWVLPGGLTRVALPEGELVVNSSQGGGSKDTWVLSPSPNRPTVGGSRPDEEDDDAEAAPEAVAAPQSPTTPDDAEPDDEPDPSTGAGPLATSESSTGRLTVTALPVRLMPQRGRAAQPQEEQQQQAPPFDRPRTHRC
jgi:hypothetical protein